jgi:hypothetical protein
MISIQELPKSEFTYLTEEELLQSHIYFDHS